MNNYEPGTYKARATRWDLGTSTNGHEQLWIEFTFLEGLAEGLTIDAFLFFTEKTWARTIESMRACGWTGTDMTDLSGLDANEVEIVVDNEEYEGKTRSKVKWINAPGRVALKSAMSDAQRKAFAAKMRGQIIALEQREGKAPQSKQGNKKKDDSEIPF